MLQETERFVPFPVFSNLWAAHAANVANYRLMHSQVHMYNREQGPNGSPCQNTIARPTCRATTKLQATAVDTFRQKELYLLCRMDEHHPTCLDHHQVLQRKT